MDKGEDHVEVRHSGGNVVQTLDVLLNVSAHLQDQTGAQLGDFFLKRLYPLVDRLQFLGRRTYPLLLLAGKRRAGRYVNELDELGV